jgi:hypothetical protein
VEEVDSRKLGGEGDVSRHYPYANPHYASTSRILYKTTHSTHHISNPSKLLHLISTSTSASTFYKAKYGKGAGSSQPRLPGTASRSGGIGVRHMDGDTVGGGADKIGHENIGHRLLSKMG